MVPPIQATETACILQLKHQASSSSYLALIANRATTNNAAAQQHLFRVDYLRYQETKEEEHGDPKTQRRTPAHLLWWR